MAAQSVVLPARFPSGEVVAADVSAARFHRLDAAGRYEVAPPDEEGRYRTPLLPDLAVPVAVLWEDDLPDFYTLGQMVKAMPGDDNRQTTWREKPS